MAIVGYDVQRVLENTLPDPLRSVRATLYTSLASIPWLVAIWFLWPHLPYYLIGIGAGAAIVALLSARRLQSARRDEMELVKPRSCIVTAFPKHPEDLADWNHDRRCNFGASVPPWRHWAARALPGVRPWRLRGSYWFMKGVPHLRVPVQETVSLRDGTSRHRRMYRRVLHPEYRERMLALKAHLQEKHPAVYNAVLEWWERFVRDRVVQQLYPTRVWEELGAEQRKVVNAKTQVEFLQGITIALRPDSWNRKFDRRPSHRYLSELRLALWKRFQLDGEYPNREALDGVPWPRMHKCKWIYLGDGAEWQGRHASRYYYESFRDPDSLPFKKDAKILGDTRIYSMIWREAKPQFIRYDDLKKHAIVLGGSGLGKTRSVEPVGLAAIMNGSALVILDPKIDSRLSSLHVHYARLFGRDDDFQFINIAHPTNPYNCSINPLAGVSEPVEFGSRIGTLFPEAGGDNEFFTNEGKRVGRLAASVCYWIYQYLMELCGNDPALSQRPPKLLLWLEYCRAAGVDAGKGPQAIEAAKRTFEALHDRLWKQGSTFQALDDAEKAVAKLWGSRFYTADAWSPSYLHVKWYAAQRPHRLVSWGVRLVHFHLLAGHADWGDVEWPERDSDEAVCGARLPPLHEEKRRQTLLEFYQEQRTHPIEVGADEITRQYMKRWRPLYEAMVPRERVVNLRRIMREFADIFDEHISSATQAAKDPETYKKHTGTLDAPVSVITAGPTGRLLCDPNPDITWQRIHLERKIVDIKTAVMVDADVSNCISKTVTQSLKNYAGRVNADGGGDLEVTVLADEMASWITKDWGHVVDKLRGTGVRTISISQSLAGLRAESKSQDLIKHIYTNQYTKIQYATQSKEDADAFGELLRKVQIFAPKRSINETPGFGGSGALTVNQFSVGEGRDLSPEAIPLVSADMLARLPVGQCFLYQGDRLLLIQTAYLADAVFDKTQYLAEVGMDRERQVAEVDGIDYGEDRQSSPEGWGSTESLERAQEALANGHIAAEDLDNEPPPPVRPGGSGGIDIADLLGAAALSSRPTPAAEPERKRTTISVIDKLKAQAQVDQIEQELANGL